MDPDWFGYATSGTLIVSWAGASGRASPEPPMGFSGSALETPYSQHAPVASRGNQRTAQSGSQGEGARYVRPSSPSFSKSYFVREN